MTRCGIVTPDEAAARERLRDARGFIFDMDGTLVLGDRVNHGLRPLPGAVEMLAWVRGRGLPYVVFTNGTNRSPAHFARVLREAGLDVPDERDDDPGEQRGRHVHQARLQAGHGARRRGLTEPLREAGIEVGAADARRRRGGGRGRGGRGASSAGSPSSPCPRWRRRVHAVWAGADLYSASQTPFFASAGGRALGTSRAISAMIRSLTGCRLTVTGKPSLDALRAAAARLGRAGRPTSR